MTAGENTAVRIRELDGLRGLAVLAVLVWHFVGGMAPGDGTFLTDVLRLGTVFGRTGVDLFFVLSGFLIIGILIDYGGVRHWKRVFYLRRTLRIWPPYLMLVLLYWLCYRALGESEAFNTTFGFWIQFLSQLSFTFGLLMAIDNGPVARAFSVVWSVNIEEWFYLLFPFFIVSFHGKSLARFLLLLGLASALARAAACLLFHAQSEQYPYVLMPLRLDGLCAGGLVAIAVRNAAVRDWVKARGAKLWLVSLVFLALGALVIVSAYNNGTLGYHMYVWGHLYLAIDYAAIVLLAVTSPLKAAVLRSSILGHFARYSYTLYLIHPLCISVLFQYAGRREVVSSGHDLLLWSLALTSSMAISVASYWMIERRLIAIGQRARYEE